MAKNSLSNTKINVTFKSLLHANGEELPAELQEDIYDGSGNKSSLKLGRSCNGATVCGPFVCDALTADNLTLRGGDLVVNGSLSVNTGQMTLKNRAPTFCFVDTNAGDYGGDVRHYGACLHVNNGYFYIIPTGQGTAVWNDLRPLYISLENGLVNMNHGLIVHGGGLNVYGLTTLHNGCNIGGTCQANTFGTYSSIRLKEDVKPIKNALEIVKRLEGVTFAWKETGKYDTGLIAEEVEKVAPDFVIKDENNIPQAVDYGRITSLLIEAVKDLALLIQTK